MDDLDKELFSSSLKKINTSSSLPKTHKSGLDFDEDDPLGDLLSSSGDDTPVKSVAKKAPSKEIPNLSRQQSKSKLISDLFGLDAQEEVHSGAISTSATAVPKHKTEDPGDWLGLKLDSDNDQKDGLHLGHENYSLPKSKTPSLSKVKSREDNFLGSGTIYPSKTVLPETSDDFSSKLKLTDHRKRIEDIQEPKKTSSILSSFMSDFDSKPVSTVESPRKVKESESGFNDGKNLYLPSANRESRRSFRGRGGNLTDPLGLFSSSNNQTVPLDDTGSKEIQTRKREAVPFPAPQVTTVAQVSNTDEIPQWLGGSSAPQASVLPSHDFQKVNATDGSATAGHGEGKPLGQSNIDILAGLVNLETQAGEAATQQQKSLITALTLKRQEDALLRLQAQQAALLNQHEQQLGALVQRQVQRQQQMMRQQEQIQAHIQALMVQPPPIPSITLPSTLWNIEDNMRLSSDSQVIIETSKSQMEKDSDVIAELKSQVQKLDSKNQDLRAQLELEKQRHENNLDNMQNLFKRQLSVQEDAMIKQEKRFISEIDTIEKEAASRITRLKDEHSEASKQQAQRMAQLHGEWLADLQRLSEFHQQAVEMLRSEQTSAVEHWKNLQIAEIEAVKKANAHARFLETAVKNLQQSSASLEELKDQIRKESQFLHLEKEEALKKREAHLTVLQAALEKQVAAIEAERQSISSMSKDLESHLTRQQQEINNERSRFEARQKAWEDEKLGAIEILNQDKKHLEQLQEQALAELADLGEKKLALATEVARLETTLQVQGANANRNSQQAEQMVAEARSTLEAAQEAGKEVQLEREEIMALKSSLYVEQKRLSSLEKEIQCKEQHIQDEIARAKAYKEEGLSALNEARRLERERTEHASDLAQRLLHLKEREDHLAEEKLAVTMEWKRIQESRDNSTCCRCGPVDSANISSFHSTKNIVDPLPIIMKLEAEQGLDYINLDHLRFHSSILESVSQ